MNKRDEIIYLSDYLKINKDAFKERKIYNPILGYDAQLFVDPVLFEKSSIKEFKNSKEKIKNFFERVAKLIILYSNTTNEEEKENYKKLALNCLSFKETANTFLGYSLTKDAGSGIGEKLAKSIFNNLLGLLKHINVDESYIDLFPIFTEYIKEDRYSDLLISILKDEFKEFSKRMIQEMGGNIYTYNNSDIFIFPQDILVKKQLSFYIYGKDEFHSAILNKFFEDKIQDKIKEAVLEMHKKYKENSLSWSGYDFNKDMDLIQKWAEIGKIISESFNLTKENSLKNKNLFEKTLFILEEFKYIVENNGIGELFYNEKDKKPKKEKTIQRVFFATAYYFCKITGIDLIPETDAGRGYLDFKTSVGTEKVAIEFKIGKSLRALNHGFYTQLEEYKKAERTDKGIFVIVILSEEHKQVYDKFVEKLNITKDRPKSEIVLVNAISKKSASKFEGV